MTKFTCLAVIYLIGVFSVSAQDTVSRVIPIDQLFQLTENNSQQLKISYQEVGISQGKTEITKSARLPEISASVDGGYLSTIAILRPDFSWVTNVKTPHFSNNYFVEASETLYKGGAVNLGISRGQFLEELARFNYEKDKQNVKLFVLGKYLDLFQLYNQRVIYKSNITLAQRRLRDVEKLREEGLVTGNDVIRSKLQIADFQLDLDHVENGISIINNDLCEVLSLTFTRIVPDTSIQLTGLPLQALTDYKEMADRQQPAIKAAGRAEKVAEKNLAIEKTARLPELSIFAGDAMQRPFLYTLEPLNVYFNAYQVGLKVRYNISSIYHTKDRINVAKLQFEQEKTRTIFTRQQAEIEVNTAYTLFIEAQQRYRTLQQNLELANDNFRIVEKKFLNQLSQLTDMLDASTAKLSAELRLNNERINIINQWYRLQKAIGNF